MPSIINPHQHRQSLHVCFLLCIRKSSFYTLDTNSMNHLTIDSTDFMIKNQLTMTPLRTGQLVVLVIISINSHTRLPLCSRFMIYITIGLYRVKITMLMVLDTRHNNVFIPVYIPHHSSVKISRQNRQFDSINICF